MSRSILIIVCGVALASVAHANKNFVPDWTFAGSSLTDTEQLGAAHWSAQNGDVIGTPSAPDGGWLLFNNPVQDVQMATSFQCAAGCQAGLLLRLEKTADGFKGVFVSISETPGAFAVTLDAHGRVLTREPLERGGGTVRALAPPPPAGAPDATRAGGPARGGPGRGGPARGGGAAGRGGAPERSPYTRPEYAFRPGEWNTLEAILDANILRSWLNDGPEAGVASGRVDDQIARYGRVGLYVGGTTAVRYRAIETKDLGRRVFSDEQIGAAFRLQRLNDFYDAWSATAADVNRDGVLDVIAGPRYFLGPDYRVSREIYVTRIYNPGSEYAAAAMNIAHDYTGDGFPDLVTSEGRSFVLYVNPGRELRRWDRYPAFANTAEVVAFHDVTRDGAPDVIVLNNGMVSVATVNRSAPTSPWIVHPVSGPGYTVAAQHGLGAGDINGDGRVDVVTPYGWWEHPASGFGGVPAEAQGAKAEPWPYHPVAFGRWPRAGASPGGGELRVADFNGDGLNDVVASLEAHGWGLAWFEQKRSPAGEISWAQHMIIDDVASKNPGGVAISEIHAITTADVDGDGVTDVVAGKRLFSHLDSYTDPDPHGDAVLYVFRTVRDKRAPGGATFVPQLVHNRSGVGSMVQTADLNKDGAVDILTATNRGTFIFWGSGKKGVGAVLPGARVTHAQLADTYSLPRPANCCLLNTATMLAEQLQDWNQLGRYHDANKELMKRPVESGRVVFIGDSITDGYRLDEAFPGKPYINRGISGQTTAQMLVRFYPDVIALKPAAVIILAGTNDIARNNGPQTLEMIQQNIMAMTELAQLHGVRVVLSALTPINDRTIIPAGGRGGGPTPRPRIQSIQRPPADLLKFNSWLESYAAEKGAAYADYYTATVDAQGFLRNGYTNDGLHPNAQGYTLMTPVASAAIAEALKR